MCHIANQSEADHEYVWNMGAERPEDPWILSSRDVWYKNPYYDGPEVPHPEEEDLEYRNEDLELQEYSREEMIRLNEAFS